MPKCNSSVYVVPCSHCGEQPTFRIFAFTFFPIRPRYLCKCGVSGPIMSFLGPRQNAADVWNKIFSPPVIQPDDKLIDEMLDEGLQLEEDDETLKLLQVELEKGIIENRIEELTTTSEPYDLANYLISVGYRAISNKHKMVSRVDRPDFVQILAQRLLRAPADFYVPGQDRVTANWVDHYRRGISSDKRSVPDEVFKLMKGSTWDHVGYVQPMGA